MCGTHIICDPELSICFLILWLFSFNVLGSSITNLTSYMTFGFMVMDVAYNLISLNYLTSSHFFNNMNFFWFIKLGVGLLGLIFGDLGHSFRYRFSVWFHLVRIQHWFCFWFHRHVLCSYLFLGSCFMFHRHFFSLHLILIWFHLVRIQHWFCFNVSSTYSTFYVSYLFLGSCFMFRRHVLCFIPFFLVHVLCFIDIFNIGFICWFHMVVTIQ